jgi:hypothetical protein
MREVMFLKSKIGTRALFWPLGTGEMFSGKHE